MRIAKLALVSLLMTGLCWTFAAQASEKEEVFAYQDIQPPQPTSSGNKVEVVEMFWYGCPHCYKFEPELEQWQKSLGKDVEFKRVPAIFNDKWALLARAYYTAEALGVLDRIHRPLFDAIHRDKQHLDDPARVADFFAKHGVDRQQFNSTFYSFAVNTKVSWAKHLTDAYKIDGVPSMIVQGRYRTSASLAGGHKEVLQVVDALISKEQK